MTKKGKTKTTIDITKKIDKQAYQKYCKLRAPKSKVFSECVRAFITGGAFCCVGQLILKGAQALMLTEKQAGAFTSAAMILIGALLTGLGVYDIIGKFAGAGSIVPITGFANSIVAPALEFRREGLITGVGAKLFVIAGPVLVYGISVATLLGAAYYIFGLFG